MQAQRRLLALDYDGTLAPFHPDRMKAFPLEGIPEILEKISDSGETDLVIISGRMVDEVIRLLGDIHVTLIRNHGSEMRRPDGTRKLISPTPEQRKRLRNAGKDALEFFGGSLQERLEEKLTGIALHTRGMGTGSGPIH